MQHIRTGIVRNQKRMSDPLELELDEVSFLLWELGGKPQSSAKVVCVSAEPSLQSLNLDLANHLCSFATTSYKWLGGTRLEQINIHRRRGSANASLPSDGLEAAVSITSFWRVSHLIWRSFCRHLPISVLPSFILSGNIGLCPTRHRHRELWQVLFSPHLSGSSVNLYLLSFLFERDEEITSSCPR